jgi:hypothetical protein
MPLNPRHVMRTAFCFVSPWAAEQYLEHCGDLGGRIHRAGIIKMASPTCSTR